MTDANKAVVLKPGKEKALLQRHHWIFSGAIAKMPLDKEGELLQVFSSKGESLGWGFFNSRCSLRGRLLSFGSQEPKEALYNAIKAAIVFRRKLYPAPVSTNAYRLINGEGDCLPGLIVDQYDSTLVVQSGALGIDLLMPTIVSYLVELVSPKAIYEKSLSTARVEEGLKNRSGWLYGEESKRIEIIENDLKYLVDPVNGQKTGFFLDQAEMRKAVRGFSKGKNVLNCFSYSGGFSISALAGGAFSATSVDISAPAIAMAAENAKLNGFSETHKGIAADVFEYLNAETLPFDLIILDPPAFAKRKKDVMAACRGYKEINRAAIKKAPKGALLLTNSCSYNVDEKLFQQVVFQAALEAGREVKVIGRHTQSPDHPVNLFHPEGDYLKSLWLYIE